MAKTLLIVEDDVFQGLPDRAQKKLLSEVASLLSFIPGFAVKTLQPLQFPGREIHFTDSVVSRRRCSSGAILLGTDVEESDETSSIATVIATRIYVPLRCLTCPIHG